MCSYNALAAHAAAVEKFRQTASGRIGIALDSEWAVPASSDDQVPLVPFPFLNLLLFWLPPPFARAHIADPATRPAAFVRLLIAGLQGWALKPLLQSAGMPHRLGLEISGAQALGRGLKRGQRGPDRAHTTIPRFA